MKKALVIIGLLTFIILSIAAVKKQKKKVANYKVALPEFVADYFDTMKSPIDNPLSANGVELGRQLFYDGILSKDYTVSCGTCHQQQYAFSDPRVRSVGIDGGIGVRHSMSIQNLAWSNFFFWDGRSKSLEDQAFDPITNPVEMASDWKVIIKRLNKSEKYKQLFYAAFNKVEIDSLMVLRALSQFQRTIVSFDSKFDKYYYDAKLDLFSPLEERGLDIFMNAGQCNHCHSDVLFTDNFYRNNGLDAVPDSGLAVVTKNATDIGKFKVPTLRNIAVTAPYMHDGRFKTLSEVIDFYFKNMHVNSQNLDEHMTFLSNKIGITDYDKKALIAFLNTLTDSTFLNNKSYQDPVKDGI